MALKENFVIAKSESWRMFDRISPQYDFLNHFLSFGFDIHWRRKLKNYLPIGSQQKILDLATGTADVLLTLVKDNPQISEAHGIDLADQMLSIGRKKINQAGLADRIHLQHGDAQQIANADNAFDAVTIAFGIRNVPNPIITLKEIFRVLKKGGRALVLEFSLPGNFFIRIFYLLYLKILVPLLGGIFSGNFKACFYLNQTIGRFPYGKQFCRMMEQVGLENVAAHPLLFGVATIYQGDRLS